MMEEKIKKVGIVSCTLCCKLGHFVVPNIVTSEV
jgi:hypothetical protein